MKTKTKKTKDFTSKLLAIQHSMLNFAYSLTLNKDDAKDLTQETTIKVLSNEEKFVNNTNFKGWVLTIMRNIFINQYRKQLVAQTIIDSRFGDLYDIKDNKGESFIQTDSLFALNEIRKAISDLPQAQRQPFAMFVEGFKYEEIAEKLQLPLGTVKSRIFLARKILQEQLKDYR
ncbi:MAG: sigma-70 family RNA polymerase sigma factor [Paludibacteraceae bacterium]|nr:sigma-70 family RNA polymerase sigma factor [Paludibacteraceae bacterium]